MDNLSSAQQIFAVFYAIFFGTMLQSLGSRRSVKDNKKYKNYPWLKKLKQTNASLNLFDTPNATALGISKPWFRTFLSIVILNIFPAWLFAQVFLNLCDIRVSNSTQILSILWISLAPQQIYRLFYAVLAWRSNYLYMSKLPDSKYNDYDQSALALLYEDRLQFDAHKKAGYHLVFPLLVYSPSAVLAYNYFLKPFNDCVVTTAWIFFLFGLMIFTLPGKYKKWLFD